MNLTWKIQPKARPGYTIVEGNAEMKTVCLILGMAATLCGQVSTGNAKRIHGRDVAETAPSDTNVLCWDAGAGTWKPCAAGSGGIGDVTGGSGLTTPGVIPMVDTTIGKLTDTKLSCAGGVCTLYDATPSTGASTLVVRAGAGQSTANLQEWKNAAGTVIASLDNTGMMAGSFSLDGSYSSLTRSGTAASLFSDGGYTSIQLGSSSAPLIKINGATSAFPAIKRNGTGIDFRLADDSAYAPIAASNMLGQRVGLSLDYVDEDTVSISAGGCVTTGGTALSYAGGNITFASLDTGARVLGNDYAVFLTAAGPKITLISVYHAGGLVPATYTSANTCLLGYFHNGKSVNNANALGAIFEYSVTSNDKLNRTYPYRGVKDLAAGIPLPGMVKVGNLAIGIYKASHEDATPTAAGSTSYPVSRYGVVPWVSIQGWDAMQVAAQTGNRLPTWAEWLASVQFYPGSVTGARMNGNTDYGSSSDGGESLSAPGAATVGVSTGPGLTGAYYYKITLVNANGETMAGTASTVVNPSNETVNLTAIPTGAVDTTARNIYRTAAGGSTYKFLHQLADNSTTVWDDVLPDVSLGAGAPVFNTTGLQYATNDPSCNCGRSLLGTGPRTAVWSSTMTGRSWYSPAGIADPVGNLWEFVTQFFGGLKTSGPGGYVAWGSEGDGMWNIDGQSYNPDTSGWTNGLPSMLYVGGSWYDGSLAGVRSGGAGGSPGGAFGHVGFRLAR